MRSPSALIELMPHSAMPTDGVVVGRRRDQPRRRADVHRQRQAGVGRGREHRVPVAARERRQPDRVRVLDEDDRPSSPSPRTVRSRAPRAAVSHNGIIVCGMNRSGYAAHHSSSIQSFHACRHASARSLSIGFEEAVAAEARERREQQLGPHAVFVHRAHALVDVVRGRDHVVVVAGEQVVALARPRRRGTGACARCPGTGADRSGPPTPSPARRAPARRSAAPASRYTRRDVVDEHARRLDHVVVDGDELRVRGEHPLSLNRIASRRPALSGRGLSRSDIFEGCLWAVRTKSASKCAHRVARADMRSVGPTEIDRLAVDRSHRISVV